MSIFSEWVNRLRYAARRDRFEDELDEEIRFHLETRAAELEQSGLSRDDARGQARREFGSATRMREESRSAWEFQWLEDIGADLRYAFRSFLRSPGFTITAVLSLALGIGANTAIFSALDTVLWRPLPVAEPASLVKLSVARKAGGSDAVPAELVRMLAGAGIFSDVMTSTSDGLSFSYDDRAERIVGEAVSPNFFTGLGVQPMLGQGFTPAVHQGNWAAEAVISYNFWKRRFGADPAVIGKSIRLNTYPFTIVGVSPPSFFGLERGSDYELRIPILPPGTQVREIDLINGSRFFSVVARLKPGVTQAQATAAAAVPFQEFQSVTTNPRYRPAAAIALVLRSAKLGVGSHEVLRQLRDPLYVVMGLVAIVLLITCVNVANMLLARATAREREFAIRISIGAGRFRLIRQMLTESVLLSFTAGALGIAVAYWSSGVLFRFLPQGHVSIVLDITPDARALLLTLGLSIGTGTLFGLAPAIQLARRDLAGTIKWDSAASLGGVRNVAFRKILICSQVAFSLILLMAAGMFVRVLAGLRPLAFQASTKSVQLFTLKPQPEIYTPERKRLLAAELVRRVSEIPGVEAAGLAENGPLGSRGSSFRLQAPAGTPMETDVDWATPRFLDTIGIPLLNGRDFTPADQNGKPVAIVNQSLARQMFPNQNPIGQTVTMISSAPDVSPRAFEIIGLVADTVYYDIRKPHTPVAWFPFDAPYMPTLHVRGATSAAASIDTAVRKEFDRIDKGFPVFNVKTLDTRIADSLSSERMVANISGVFGLLAVTLAAIGIYGVLAYSVSRRTREIGIRIALGSGYGTILAMVAREVGLLVGAGTIAGAGIAVAAARILSPVLPPTASLAPSILAACAGLMLMITILAACVPAIRACRVDPLAALRHE